MRKDSFRDHFRDYVQRELKSSFDGLNDKQRSIWMAKFFADEIVRSLNPGLIPESEEDLDACLIDGKDDCGVDFFVKEGNSVIVIQAKYSGEKKSGKKAPEKADTFDYFCGVLSRLYAGCSKFAMNSRLKEAIAEIDWERDTFLLYYITLQKPAGNSLAKAKQGVDSIRQVFDLQERASLELLAEEQLNNRLRDAKKQDQVLTESIRVRFSTAEGEEPWLCCEDSEAEHRSYIGRISGAHIAELFQQHKSGLFALNIRNYIGDTSTNKAIRKTAISTPHDFFYANNGICAVATRVRPDEEDEKKRTLLCDRFSIINGAQTVRSLSKAHSENADALRDVQVLIRLVEYDSKITQSEQAFLDGIIRNNNTQNAIKISDFRSNDQVQISLSQHFSKLPALRGKKFAYKNKRSGEREILRIPIPLEELIKTVHAFRFGPDDIYGGASYLFNTERQGGYFKLFGDETELKTSLSQTEFEDIASVWFICDYVRKLWKNRSLEQQTPALERRWLVFWAVGESFRVVYKDDSMVLRDAFRKLSLPYWLDPTEGKGEHYRVVIEKHFNLAAEARKKAYALAENTEDFSHRNWFRSTSTLPAVRAELASFSFLTSQLMHQFKLGKGNDG